MSSEVNTKTDWQTEVFRDPAKIHASIAFCASNINGIFNVYSKNYSLQIYSHFAMFSSINSQMTTLMFLLKKVLQPSQGALHFAYM